MGLAHPTHLVRVDGDLPGTLIIHLRMRIGHRRARDAAHAPHGRAVGQGTGAATSFLFAAGSPRIRGRDRRGRNSENPSRDAPSDAHPLKPEPPGQVRTKIVATVGPASNTDERLRDLMEAGVDVFRLNFSHGTQDEHSRVVEAIRRVSDESGRNIAVLQDLGGPKLRLGPIPGDAVECRLGDEFSLVRDRTADDPRQLTCTYRALVDDLKVGDVVLFADGTVAMDVTHVEPGRARLIVTLGGKLRSKQGINLPNADLRLEALTDKDLADLDWTAKHGVEYVGLSFVRRAADVERLRDELKKRGCHSRIVAKIEKPQAVDDLDAIIAASDAVMVARGDLGVEMDVARVPAIQKRIISACHRARIPVITATQMLNSMENSNRPTRAEATDVFNAVLDGTDAVMLSGETAVGQYPIEAVETMSRIVREAEAYLAEGGAEVYPRTHLAADRAAGHVPETTEAIVEAASLACRRLPAKLLVVSSHSGRTALAVSKSRNATPTIAFGHDAATARAMALYWGVTPLVAPAEMDDVEHTLNFAIDWARARGLVAPGRDRLVWAPPSACPRRPHAQRHARAGRHLTFEGGATLSTGRRRASLAGRASGGLISYVANRVRPRRRRSCYECLCVDNWLRVAHHRREGGRTTPAPRPASPPRSTPGLVRDLGAAGGLHPSANARAGPRPFAPPPASYRVAHAPSTACPGDGGARRAWAKTPMSAADRPGSDRAGPPLPPATVHDGHDPRQPSAAFPRPGARAPIPRDRTPDLRAHPRTQWRGTLS